MSGKSKEPTIPVGMTQDGQIVCATQKANGGFEQFPDNIDHITTLSSRDAHTYFFTDNPAAIQQRAAGLSPENRAVMAGLMKGQQMV